MDARAGQAAELSVLPEAARRSSAAAAPHVSDWRRQVTVALAVVMALAAGLALVPSFEADVAYRSARSAADAAFLDEAEADIMRAISWTPQDAYLYQFLGGIYYRKALYRPRQRRALLGAALAAFDRSARLNPYDAETFTLIGWTRLYGADAPSAEAAFLKAKELDPNNPYVRYSLGTAYLWQKKLTQARGEMVFAHRFLPNAGEVLAAIQEIDRLQGPGSP